MPSLIKLVTAALAVAAPLASAQTYSDCNPMKESNCPADKGSTESTLHFDFTKSNALDQWQTTAGKVNIGSDGAEFKLAKKGDAPTIRSKFYFWYGEVSVEMKAAPGQGVISSIVLESDTLDEVDWEALGGNNAQIQTNYFGKGDTTTYDRDTWPNVATPQDVFHTYTVKWTPTQIIWLIDNQEVRTLNKADAQGGTRFPQTPMDVRIGIWAGGDPGNGQGTIDWAGGPINYSQAPFSMWIKSVTVKNDNPAESYSFSDQSGNAESIKKGGSVASRSTSTDSVTTSTESSTSASTSASTTLATTTQGSSTTKSTDASSTEASGAASTSGVAGSTESGSATSAPGTESGSASSSPSSSPTYNAASILSSPYLGPASLLGLLTAMLQL